MSIVVPRDVALKLGVVSASGLISGLREDASISTVSGDLTIDGMSGELSVRNHYGKVVAHTVSGDVTVSGEAHAFSCDGVSGEVMLDLTGTPDEVKVNTVSGRVTARLDADAATSYSISTVSGRLQLDATQITALRGRWTGKFGELDKHWVDFRANTVSGDVSVLHTARATASA